MIETSKNHRQNYRNKRGNGQKLTIKTSFFVVNPFGENGILEKADTAGARFL